MREPAIVSQSNFHIKSKDFLITENPGTAVLSWDSKHSGEKHRASFLVAVLS